MVRTAKPLEPMAPIMLNTPPADGRCVWNKLPPELKDIIFEMSYVPNKPMKPLSKTMWTWRETHLRQKQEEDYWPGRFFTVVEQRFLVSREWCSAALEIFYRHAEFYLEDDNILYHFLVDGNKNGWPRPHAEHITSIVVPIGIDPDDDSGCVWNPAPDVTARCLVRVVNACPGLTRLKIRCTCDWFEEDLEYLEGLEHLDEIDWNKLYEIYTLGMLYGISHLSIEPIIQEDFECPNACVGTWRCKECRKRPYVEDTRECVQDSFKMIENLLRPRVARPLLHTATGEDVRALDEVGPELI